MSRHIDIEKIDCCAPARSVAVDWEQFLATGTATTSLPTPIDEFYEAQQSLAKLSRLLGDASLAADASALLAGQVLLSYVSATELYFRRAIARMVRICPFVRGNASAQTIPFGAVDYYGTRGIEHALTEQVTFTEQGKVRSQLQQRLDVQVRAGTSLERSIADFEKLSNLRHALVHSHGVLNSANASQLLGASGNRARRTNLDEACLGWAASVTLNLVRDVNTEIVRSTLWRWVSNGYISTDRRRSRPRVKRLLDQFGSQVDLENGDTNFELTASTDLVVAIAGQCQQ